MVTLFNQHKKLIINANCFNTYLHFRDLNFYFRWRISLSLKSIIITKKIKLVKGNYLFYRFIKV